MQPKTSVKMDKESFLRLRKTIANMALCERKLTENPSFSMEMPAEIGLQLTSRCNLRCKHCFEWSECGYNHSVNQNISSDELSLDLLERILKESEKVKSGLYLWGGEPLVYTEWDRFSRLLEKDPRWSVLCTNGIKVIEKMDSLLRISPNLAILTSLEGFEKENDIIRGTGNYRKTIEGIQEVRRLQKSGEFKGLQSVNCTINDSMIGKLYDFVEFCEELKLNTIYLGFPWYISKDIAKEMDEYFERNFQWLGVEPKNRSWYSFDYHISEDKIDALIRDLEKINGRTWKIRIRYQPALELEEVADYVKGVNVTAQKKRHCLALSNRMDVLSDGSVSACKLFSEFRVGNLYDNSIQEIWKSPQFNRMREVVWKEIMPVCSRCILLYLNGK